MSQSQLRLDAEGPSEAQQKVRSQWWWFNMVPLPLISTKPCPHHTQTLSLSLISISSMTCAHSLYTHQLRHVKNPLAIVWEEIKSLTI